jgi:hypothetical protein
MDRFSNSYTNTTQPTTRAFTPEIPASVPVEEKIESLLGNLTIWHCEKSTVLKALQHTFSANKEAPVDHVLTEFAKGLKLANLSSDEIRLLQQGLIAHLPEHMKQEAAAFFTTPAEHGQQLETQDRLGNWLAAHISAAKALEGLSNVPGEPPLGLSALSYAWGFQPSQALRKTTFIEQFENAKKSHLQNLISGSQQFVDARNAFNNAVRSQLVNLNPAIKAQYEQLDASGIGYEEKGKQVGHLIQLHLNINKMIAAVPQERWEPWAIAHFAAILTCEGFLSPASSDSVPPLIAAAFSAGRDQHLARFASEQERKAAASKFDEALLHQLGDLVHPKVKDKYRAIMNGPGSLEQKKKQLSAYDLGTQTTFIHRMTSPGTGPY